MRSMHIPDLTMSQLHASVAAMQWEDIVLQAEANTLWRGFQCSLAEIEGFVFLVAVLVSKNPRHSNVRRAFEFTPLDRKRR
jgi:hypothetical protein